MSWRRQSFRYGLLAVLLAAVTALALYVVMVLGAPTTGPAPTPAVKASSPAPAPPATPAKAPPFSAYDVVVKRDLFRTGPPPQTRAPLPPVPTFPLPPAAPPEETSPISGWSYVGYAVVDGQMTAILENDTKASEFVRAGDTFVGLQMSAVTPETVTLTGPSGDYTLPISTAFNTTPLSATTPPGQAPRPSASSSSVSSSGRSPVLISPGVIFTPSGATAANPAVDPEMLRRWQEIRDRRERGRRDFRQRSGNGQGTTQPQPSTGPSGQQ